MAAAIIAMIDALMAQMDSAPRPCDEPKTPYVPLANDILEIHNCIHGFVQCLDNGDGKGMAQLFTKTGQCEIKKISKTVTGTAGIISFCESLHERFQTVSHFESNIIIKFQSGKQATNISYWTGIDGDTTVSYGIHKDALVKDDDGHWKFAHRQIEHIWSTKSDQKRHTNAASGITVRAFRGYHPPAELMSTVASPPYDVINTAEARLVTEKNEKSFLNVNKPQTQFNPPVDQYSDQVYEMGRTQIEKFCANKWLIQDTQPSLYIYSQRMGDHEQFGLVAEASAIEYERNLIKKHELTRKDKEDDRTKLTDVQSANVGPIFLCYKTVQEINGIIEQFVAEHRPYSDFVADDGIQHKLWVIQQEPLIERLSQLFRDKVPCCYVADGHHRTASAWRVYKKRRAELEKLGKYKGDEPFHYFLAVLFPHDHLQILDYNRVVRDFGAIYKHDKHAFLKALNKDWRFEKIDMDDQKQQSEKELNELLKTKQPNDFRMYIHNDGWYRLSARQHVLDAVKHDVVKRLDVSVLSEYLLQPVMRIMDIRTNPSISFVGGIHGLVALQKKVDAKKSGVAFALYHTTIDQLLDVADAKRLMPPKSTWFEPKLRSGVVVRRF